MSVIIMVTIGLNSMVLMGVSVKMLRDETMKLNQNSLNQTADKIGDMLSEILFLGQNIGDNMQIINACTSELDAAHKIGETEMIHDILQEYMLYSRSHKNLVTITILGDNNNVFTHEGKIVDAETFKNTNIYQDFINQDKDYLLSSDIQYDEDEYTFRYTFQIMVAIEDHITNETVGFLLIDASEILLFSEYKTIENNGTQLFIVDKEGQLVSSPNKKRIDKKSEWKVEDLIYRDGKQIQEIIYRNIYDTEWYMVKTIPKDTINNSFQNIQITTIQLIVASTVIVLVVQWLFMQCIFNPIRLLKERLDGVTQGDLTTNITSERKDEFGQIYSAFNEMRDKLDTQMVLIQKKEKQKRLLELDFLRAQINPHFIYNTLSSIRFYMEMKKTNEAEDMLFLFTKLLRKTLSRSDEYISIRQEIEILKDYVQLQSYRYTDTFQVTYQVDEGVLDKNILALIIQPIMENAIFHAPKKGIVCNICVSISCMGEYISIKVIDDGMGMDRESLENILATSSGINGIGLTNVNHRLILNYGSECKLNIESQQDKGSVVGFLIPNQKEGEEC